MGGGLRGRESAREVKQRKSESSARKGLRELMLREKGIRQSTFSNVFILAMTKAGRENNKRNGELPMGVRSDKFGNRVSKGGPRTYVKDGKRVLPIVHAPSREDDRDKVYARVLK